MTKPRKFRWSGINKQLTIMKEVLKEIVECQKKLSALSEKLRNSVYWINRAKEEAGFEPHKGVRVYAKIQEYGIEVSIYPEFGTRGARYWINGMWFETCFPSKIPSRDNILKNI